MKHSVSTWQAIGFIFTAIAGTLLHFLYGWSGQSLLLAPFSAVNESIWEHMKLLYFPMLLFAVIESRYLSQEYTNFWCAKLIGTAIGLFLIPVLYYTYTGALGIWVDWFNITIFFIAAGVTFFLEALLLEKRHFPCQRPVAAFLLMILMGLAFAIFTFMPPQTPLFQDPASGQYGLIA